MDLGDLLGKAGDVLGNVFTANANAEAAAATSQQQGTLALLTAQQQSNQAALNAQTTQKVSMYVALAVVGLVAFMMLERRAR